MMAWADLQRDKWRLLQNGQEKQNGEATSYQCCILLSSHQFGGECPLLNVNMPGFGRVAGDNDKHTFNWDRKHLPPYTCFQTL